MSSYYRYWQVIVSVYVHLEAATHQEQSGIQCLSLKDTLTGGQEEPQTEQSTLRLMAGTHRHLSLSCLICLPNLCSPGTKRLTQPPELQIGLELKMVDKRETQGKVFNCTRVCSPFRRMEHHFVECCLNTSCMFSTIRCFLGAIRLCNYSVCICTLWIGALSSLQRSLPSG